MKLIERLFELKKNGTTVRAEIIAGVTTFVTMAYILAVCPNIMGQAGVPSGGVFVATVGAAVAGTLFMALFANYPFALAPGMGDLAFFTFGVVLGMGYSWQAALLAVFIDGVVFTALSLTSVREGVFNAIPLSLKKALAAGIGLFICFIALQGSGLVVAHPATLVQIVPFRDVPFHSRGISAVLAFVGTLLTGALLIHRVKAAILIGILATWGIGMLCQATGLYVPDPSVKCYSLYPSLTFSGIADALGQFKLTFGAIFNPSEWSRTVGGQVTGSGWSLVGTLDFVVVVISFLFLDLFNTIGTLIGAALKGGFLTKEGRLPRLSGALRADAVATVVGSVLGAATTTTYVESESGVLAGGRTGLTSVVTAALFLVSLLLAPVFLSIPAFATAPALIVVGAMMLSAAAEIDFSNPSESIPAFLTIASMAFTYSVADGIMWGIIGHAGVHLLSGRGREVHWIVYVLSALFIAKYALI